MPRAARILGTLALGILVGPACASAEWADWIAEGDVTFQYESNLNFSSLGGDEEDDFWWRFDTRGGRFFQLTNFTRASVEIDIGGEVYHEFDDLNAVDVGGTLAVSHKFGIGDNFLFFSTIKIGDDIRLLDFGVDDLRKSYRDFCKSFCIPDRLFLV